MRLEVCASLSKVYLGRNAMELSAGRELTEISGVELAVSDETAYFVGNRAGRVLQVSCPFGSRKMAENLLEKYRGMRYQPYRAANALVDPAAELGDYLEGADFYGGIFSRKLTFGRLMPAELSAPWEEEIDHEFPYVSQSDRTAKRLVSQAVREYRSEFGVQADKIAAKVSQIGGDNDSFGWELTEKAMTWYAGGQKVMAVDKTGLSIQGTIHSVSGDIAGFQITDNGIEKSISDSSWVAIRPDGISLGPSFRVDAGGNLFAASGTFEGTVYAGEVVSRDEDDRIGGDVLSGGVITSLGYANFSHDVFNNNETAYYVSTQYLGISANYFVLGQYNASWKSKTIDGVTIRYLGRD